MYRRPRRTTDKARDESDGASDEAVDRHDRAADETVDQSDVPSSFVAEVEAGDESSGAVVVRVGFWMSPWTVYYLALRDRGAWRVVDYLSGNNRSKNVEDFVVAEVPLGRHRIWRVGWRDVSDGTWGNGPHEGTDFSLAHSWIAFCSAAAPPFRALCNYDGLEQRLECGCVQAPALCRYELGYEGSEAQEEVAAEVRIRPGGSVLFRPRSLPKHREGCVLPKWRTRMLWGRTGSGSAGPAGRGSRSPTKNYSPP